MNFSIKQHDSFRQIPEEFLRVLEKALAPSHEKIQQWARCLQSQLWEELSKNRGISTEETNPSHYSMDPRMAKAYTAYYLPSNLMKIPLILTEMESMGLSMLSSTFSVEKTEIQSEKQKKWLDLGCGPGTALWGALTYLKQHHSESPFEFHGWDQSSEFLKEAQALERCTKLPVGTSMHWSQKKISFKKSFFESIGKLDPHIVSLSNSYSELPFSNQEKITGILSLIDQLFENHQKDPSQKSSPRWLIFLEPGSREASRDLLLLRNEIITQRSDRARIYLPCLSHRPCGALDHPKDWCHEEAEFEAPSWHQELSKQASLNKERLIFSYLVISIGSDSHSESKSWPTTAWRMVSQRLEEKGLTKCHFCTPSGKKLVRVIHSRINDMNRDFLTLTRGQVIPEPELDEKGSLIRF